MLEETIRIIKEIAKVFDVMNNIILKLLIQNTDKEILLDNYESIKILASYLTIKRREIKLKGYS